jgi:hypothetical protein
MVYGGVNLNDLLINLSDYLLSFVFNHADSALSSSSVVALSATTIELMLPPYLLVQACCLLQATLKRLG